MHGIIEVPKRSKFLSHSTSLLKIMTKLARTLIHEEICRIVNLSQKLMLIEKKTLR